MPRPRPYTRIVAVAAAVSGLAVAPAAAATAPVVWVQAGHEAPREPGYLAGTGTASGPFGEITFNRRVAAAVTGRLRAAGADARRMPGRVVPWGGRGQVFVSIHHDAPGGYAAVGYAVSDPSRGENYYHGEGSGTASPVPYPDSAPHRAATRVTAATEARSRQLAARVAARLGAVHTRANGARAPFAGVIARRGNTRMQFYYGYYRTRAGARVLVECGAGGADDPFLTRTDLVAGAVADGVVDYLRRRGALAAPGA